MQEERRFVVFACCVLVRGARRSTICDLQRGVYHFIPNGLHEILTVHRNKSMAELVDLYGDENRAQIESYFSFLESHELGFWCSEPESFPPLDSGWDPPERVTNAIIDVDDDSEHDYGSILRQLDDLGCKALEVRCFDGCHLEDLLSLLEGTSAGRLRSISLVIGYSEELTDEALERICREHARVTSLVVHSAPEDRLLRTPGTPVIFRAAEVTSPSCCGEIHPGYFSVNLATWSEGQRWNTCLNRKISIDSKGEIRNCPSMSRSFGNVRSVSLHSALAHRDFPALWSINKSQVDVCKDCEFRYICTDCRAYIADPSDLYSKPSKCSYDPYTAQWEK